MAQPMQEVYLDEDGKPRFKPNTIVSYLLDNGGIDMNALWKAGWREKFPKEDWEQFYQLIGYSLNGYAELTQVVTDRSFAKANRRAKKLGAGL